jgi:hypothetical protein
VIGTLSIPNDLPIVRMPSTGKKFLHSTTLYTPATPNGIPNSTMMDAQGNMWLVDSVGGAVIVEKRHSIMGIIS